MRKTPNKHLQAKWEMDLRLEGKRPLLWEKVNICGLRRDTMPSRLCLWSHIRTGKAGEAGTNKYNQHALD